MLGETARNERLREGNDRKDQEKRMLGKAGGSRRPWQGYVGKDGRLERQERGWDGTTGGIVEVWERGIL